MNRRLVIPVIRTPAGALVVKLLSAWDQLPDRVAVHFEDVVSVPPALSGSAPQKRIVKKGEFGGSYGIA